MPDSNPTSEAPTVHRDVSFASEQPASADTPRSPERRATRGGFFSSRAVGSFPRRFGRKPFARATWRGVFPRARAFATAFALTTVSRTSLFPSDSVSNERAAAPASTAPCVCGTRGRRRVKPWGTATCAASWTSRPRRISNPLSPRRTTTPRACFAWCRRPREGGALTSSSFE